MRITTKKLPRGGERPRPHLPAVLATLVVLALLSLYYMHPTSLSTDELLASADAHRVPARDQAPSLAHTTDDAPRKCGHVVLFSSARHGSTWFIDSVERCRYSRSLDKTPEEMFASAVFRHTEPWKHNRSALFAMSGAQVSDYVVANSSVKVFSSTMEINRPGVEELAREGARKRVPFVVLRREPEATYRSLMVAKQTGVWNGVGGKQVGNVRDMDGFDRYKDSIERYYARVDELLEKAGVVDVDVVDYDEIKEMKYIRLEQSGCYVRNCNFQG